MSYLSTPLPFPSQQPDGFAFSSDTKGIADTFAALSEKMASSAQEFRDAGTAQVEHFGDN